MEPVEVELPSRTVVIALPIVGQAVVAQDHAGPAAFGLQGDDHARGPGRDGPVVGPASGEHWAVRRVRLLQMLLSRVSPCLAYCHIYPELTRAQHEDWCRLDTYDELTDHFKRLRSVRSIRQTLVALGGVQIQALRYYHVVEARCRKPGGTPCVA